MIGDIQTRLIKEKTEKELLEQGLSKMKATLVGRQQFQEDLLKARVIVQKVAQDTQSQIEYHISNLVTKALQSVFKDNYEFKTVFVQRRNKTECDFLLHRDGKECYTYRGGVRDVVNFALLTSIWSLKKTRKVLILDEPFRFVSQNLQEQCSSLMKQLSEQLGIQIIMVSHLESIKTSANKIIKIKNVEGTAYVVE